MPILPQFALFVILQFWPLVLHLVSLVWSERQRQRYADHWLLRLEATADLHPIEQGCAGFHSDSGRGKTVTHTTPRLVRMLLLKHLLHLSLRQSEEQTDNNMLYKTFVGYGLFDRPPDHSTLCRFELWVLRHQPRLFFDTVLHQVEQLYPTERQHLFMTDTFGIFVRGARTYTIDLLRDLCRHLLTELADWEPVRHQQLLLQVDQVALFGLPTDKITAALTTPERAERLQSVVLAALELHDLLLRDLDSAALPPEGESSLRLWLTAIAKVIDDETTVTPDPDRPGQRRVKERPHGKKGSYRHACANDLAATYRDHGKGAAELQHNAGLLGTERFIFETEVVTGATPDPLTLPPMLKHLHQQHGFFPPKIVADQIYGAGKHRAQVEQLSQGQSQLIALVPAYEKRTDRFVPADFTLAADGLSLTCPHDVTATKIYAKPGADGYEFRFTAKMCQGCPYWITPEQHQQDPKQPHCRPPDGKPKAHRQVFISDYRSHILAALEYNQTEQFKQEMRRRPLVERLIFNLTHYFGARHATSTGLDKVNFQVRMAAAAFNLRQLVRLQSRRTGSPAAIG
jgi:transposase